MSSSVLKTLKRSMAAEYSRELSVKVFSGQCRLIELGFRQGGPAGYGLRRQLIDRDRNPKSLLGRGDRKSLQTDRVILVPGPEDEVETVRCIYDLFVTQGNTEREIMEMLNVRGVLGEHGRPWIFMRNFIRKIDRFMTCFAYGYRASYTAGSGHSGAARVIAS